MITLFLNDIFDSEGNHSFWRDLAGNLIGMDEHYEIFYEYPELGDECTAIEAALKAGFIRIYVCCAYPRMYVQCIKDTAEKEHIFIQSIKNVAKMHGYQMIFEIGSNPLCSG